MAAGTHIMRANKKRVSQRWSQGRQTEVADLSRQRPAPADAAPSTASWSEL